MSDTRKILVKVAIDAIVLLCSVLTLWIIVAVADPFERGFFCDDEDLRHPYKDSTITSWMLYIITFGITVSVIVITEVLRGTVGGSDNQQPLEFMNFKIPKWIVKCYQYVGCFGYGAAFSQLITFSGKYTLGRLRPHFFDVCRPIMSNGLDCTHPSNLMRYVVDYTCTNTETNSRRLKEMRLSFPSGHTSLAAYALLFCAFYLQGRMTNRGSTLLKSFLQFFLILLSWYIGVSRITDYKHHWSDVLAGFVIGYLIAYFIAKYVAKLFEKEKKQKEDI